MGWPKKESCFSIIPRIYQTISATYGDQVTGRSWQLQRVRRYECVERFPAGDNPPDASKAREHAVFHKWRWNSWSWGIFALTVRQSLDSQSRGSSPPIQARLVEGTLQRSAGWPEAASCSVLRQRPFIVDRGGLRSRSHSWNQSLTRWMEERIRCFNEKWRKKNPNVYYWTVQNCLPLWLWSWILYSLDAICNNLTD